MNHPEQWHKWPEEVPPKYQLLQIEVWNDFYEEFEPAVGVFHEGEFFHHGPNGFFIRRLFNHALEEVFWRLWEEEDEE